VVHNIHCYKSLSSARFILQQCSGSNIRRCLTLVFNTSTQTRPRNMSHLCLRLRGQIDVGGGESVSYFLFLAMSLGYGLDDRCSMVRFPAGAGNFSLHTPLGPTQPPIQWVPGALFLRVKRTGREADHSPPSSADVKEWVELYLHSPNTPSWCHSQLKAQVQLYLLCLRNRHECYPPDVIYWISCVHEAGHTSSMFLNASPYKMDTINKMLLQTICQYVVHLTKYK
jgi:hypothetical protein